jgi:hypothetical protein
MFARERVLWFMATWQKEVTNAFIEARTNFGVPFTIISPNGSAQIYYGVQRETGDMLPLGSGGFVQDYDGGLEVLNTEIDPDIGTIILLGGNQMRIQHKQSSGEDPVTLWYLIGASK